MRSLDATTFFQGAELDKWINRSERPPEPDEEFLLRKWLPPDREAAILEGGTGAGRLAFFIESLRFANLHAFDLLPDFVAGAKVVGHSRGSSVRFFQADLCDVADSESIAGMQFDAIVYYQQVFSLVPLDDWDRGFAAVRRLLRPGGRWLVSFCQYEGRWINGPLRTALSMIRFVRRQQISGYSQPLLKHGGKFNRKLLHRDQFLIHWLPRKTIEQRVREAGFDIIESVTSREVQGLAKPNRGMLYLTCEA